MLDLPTAVRSYFVAAPDADAAALGAIFTADATVHDEARDYSGIDEIRSWRLDTHARTPSTARPLSAEERDGKFVVRAEVSGAFPGSPVLLDHTFTLADDRIAALKIR